MPYTDEKHTRRVEDTKRVLRGGTPKKDRQEEFEDAKEVISGLTPKKDIHEEFEYTKGVIRAVNQ